MVGILGVGFVDLLKRGRGLDERVFREVQEMLEEEERIRRIDAKIIGCPMIDT